MCFVSIANPKHRIAAPIISVGNIVLGGTGKSVVVAYIANLLKNYSVAIVTRGYGGTVAKKHESVLVAQGGVPTYSASFCGDEAYMLACQIPWARIFAGKSKRKSCELASRSDDRALIILDDGYQTRGIAASISLVLLDARHPFENGYLFPAGPLREKDLSRADALILTHTTSVQKRQLNAVTKELRENGVFVPIYYTYHQPISVYAAQDPTQTPISIQGKSVVAFAGIGSFSSFLATLKEVGGIVTAYREYDDHHSYLVDDFEELLLLCRKKNSFALVTTEKDLPKIRKLISKAADVFCSVYVLKVSLAFRDEMHRDAFASLLISTITTHRRL